MILNAMKDTEHGSECITSIWFKVLVLFKAKIVEKI